MVCHCLPQGKQCTDVAHCTASGEAVAHCGGFPRAVNNPGLAADGTSAGRNAPVAVPATAKRCDITYLTLNKRWSISFLRVNSRALENRLAASRGTEGQS